MTKPRPLRNVIHLLAEFQGLTMLAATHGEGYTFDLSTNGCRIESDTPVQAGTFLSLRLDLADHNRYRSPLSIPVARVRWANGDSFGLEFIRMKERDRLRLEQFLWNPAPLVQERAS